MHIKYQVEYNLSKEEFIFLKNIDNFGTFVFSYINEDSVVLGKNQIILREVALPYCIKNNIKIIRRISGGGTVFHDKGNLNICIIENRNYNPQLFLQDICGYLSSYFVYDGFSTTDKFDILLDGEKISGSAFNYKKNKVLHHFTLLINPNKEKLSLSLRGFRTFDDITVRGNFIESRPMQVATLSKLSQNLTNQDGIQDLSDYLIRNISSKYGYSTEYNNNINDNINDTTISDNIASKYYDRTWNYLHKDTFDIEYKIGVINRVIKIENATMSSEDYDILPNNVKEYFDIIQIKFK